MKIGARWDDESQNSRMIKAKQQKLIEFIEVNYPIAIHERPQEIDLPIYAHSANNGLCSAGGLNYELINMIKDEANKYDSPWIGEHLSWTHFNNNGGLGYVFNTIYTDEFFEITKKNILEIKELYGRNIAIELGPQYNLFGDFSSEVDFMLEISKETNSQIILDLSHLMISNHNLKRSIDFGIDKLIDADLVEIHLSGIRKSQTEGFWHDCHDIAPNDETLSLLKEILRNNKNTIQAITLEHASNGSEKEFYNSLEKINKVVELC